MVKRIAIALLPFWLALASHAAQTKVKLELFVPADVNNIVPLDSGNTDQFSSITGTYPIVAIGATTNLQSDSGWSGEMQKANVDAAFTSAPTFGTCGMWIRFNQFGVNASDQPVACTSAGSTIFIWTVTASHGSRSSCFIDGCGNLSLYEVAGGVVAGTNLVLNTWYWVQLAWNSYNDGAWKEDVQLYYMPIGGSLTFLAGSTNRATFSQITSVHVGKSATSSPFYSGRNSGVYLGSLASFADVQYPAEVVAPTTSRTTWFVNASSGSDVHSGLDGAPWQTITNLQAHLRYGGVMGSSNAWMVGANPITNSITDSAFINAVTNGVITAGGDKVLLDASGGTFNSPSSMILRPGNQGVEIGSTNGTSRIDVRKLLAGPYTQYDPVTYTNIWYLADTDAGSVMWEDDKWMDNPAAPNIAAAAPYLSAHPCSCWNDGSNLYFVPTSDTNPNVDGKTYKRSRNLISPTVAEASAVALNGWDNYLHDLDIWAGPYRNQGSGAVTATYAVQSTSNGRTVVDRVNGRYGGNHGYCATDGLTTLKRWVLNGVYQQCAPYTTNSTGFANMTEFTGATTAGSRCAYFFGDDFSTNGVIGSASGICTNGAFYCHYGSTGGSQYATVELIKCKGWIDFGAPLVAPNSAIVINCNSIGGLSTATITNVCVTNTVITGAVSGTKGATLANCIINRTDDITQSIVIAGAWIFKGCTFDARNISTSASGNSILKTHASDAMVLTVTNCATYLTQNADEVTFVKYKAADTLTLDYNVYKLNPAGTIARDQDAGTTKTWAQWQALGHDAHGASKDPAMDTRWRPYAKTPCWVTGTELGPAMDLTGKVFQSRRTCGAYEYKSDAMLLISR